MSKTNEQKFEKKLEKEIEDQCYSMPPVTKVYFNYGARWAYQQAISDVLEKLRSDEADDSLARGFGYAKPEFVADWLEEQLLGEKK